MMIKFRELPAYTKILLGMVAGVVLGLIAANFGFERFFANWITPFGDIFILY